MVVVTGHSFVTAGSDRLELYDRLINLGVRVVVPYAIDLFFVISGYLITAILYETRTANNPIRTFYARRALRIVPLYYSYLVISRIIFFWHSPGSFGTGGPIWEILFLTNVAMLNGVSTVGYLNAHFWTVAIEEQFYFLWPLAVLLAPAKRLTWICVALILGSFVGRTILTEIGQGDIGWLLSFTRLDGLIMGGLVAILQRRHPEVLSRWARKIFLVSGTVMVPGLMLLVMFGVRRLPGTLLDTFNLGSRGRELEIIFVPLVAAIFFSSATALLVTKNTGKERILTYPPILTIAEASYGMYIFHIPILVLLQGTHATAILANYDVLNQVVISLLTIFLSFKVGHFTWTRFEKKFVKMAPRYTYPPGGKRA